MIERNGLNYKKFNEAPFSGKTTGQKQVTFKNGKMDGAWTRYSKKGWLGTKGNLKNDKQYGAWGFFYKNGIKWTELTGTHKNGNSSD